MGESSVVIENKVELGCCNVNYGKGVVIPGQDETIKNLCTVGT